MKVFLKILSPKMSAFEKKEFTIEDDRLNMTVMEVIQKLQTINEDIYTEISTDGFIHPNYLCMINNEILLYNQRNTASLKDGDNMIISFVMAGG